MIDVYEIQQVNMILNLLIQKFFVGLAELNLHQIISGQIEVRDDYFYEMLESHKTLEFFLKFRLPSQPLYH